MAELVTGKRFETPVDQETVAQDWRARGYSCQEFIDPPGQQWNDFVHRTNEVVTVIDGRLQLDVNGETIAAEPGDEVFIPRGAVHSVRNIHSDTTRWLFGYD